MSEIGYDVVKYLTEPPSWEAHRIRHGRYVTTSPRFDSLSKAQRWIEHQRQFDKEDVERSRARRPRRQPPG